MLILSVKWKDSNLQPKYQSVCFKDQGVYRAGSFTLRSTLLEPWSNNSISHHDNSHNVRTDGESFYLFDIINISDVFICVVNLLEFDKRCMSSLLNPANGHILFKESCCKYKS